MEIDNKGQLREVRKTRILVTQPVLSKDSKDNIVNKALLSVMKLVKG